MKQFLTKLSLALQIISMKGGVSMLVTVYVTLIIAKRRTIDTTPVTLRAQVEDELEILGFDGYGNPLPTAA